MKTEQDYYEAKAAEAGQTMSRAEAKAAYQWAGAYGRGCCQEHPPREAAEAAHSTLHNDFPWTAVPVIALAVALVSLGVCVAELVFFLAYCRKPDIGLVVLLACAGIMCSGIVFGHACRYGMGPGDEQ